MAAYLARRILQAIIVVILVTIIVFVLLRMLPGGPARAILGQQATATQVSAFNRAQGFDKPLALQYLDYVNRRCTAISAIRTNSTRASPRC